MKQLNEANQAITVVFSMMTPTTLAAVINDLMSDLAETGCPEARRGWLIALGQLKNLVDKDEAYAMIDAERMNQLS